METKNNLNPIFHTLMPFRNMAKNIHMNIGPHTYEPKTSDLKRDWIASVTIPAFQAYKELTLQRGTRVDHFCTIGTGSGTDALAAIEIFEPSLVTITDLHPSVVDLALKNIRKNLRKDHSILLNGGVGEICSPLEQQMDSFDLIYENLPNIPIADRSLLLKERGSSSFYSLDSTTVNTPNSVQKDLLELHYLFLIQARKFLNPGGRVLCSIGQRRPLSNILDMFYKAKYKPNILVYTWKIQSEPEEIIPGYADFQKLTGIPFYFYPLEVLRMTFDGLSPSVAARYAPAIEKKIRPYAIDALQALNFLNKDFPIGHTLTMIEGKP